MLVDGDNTGGAGGDVVVVAGRYIPDRCQGEVGDDGGIRQGRGGTVMGEKSKTPGLRQCQRKVQHKKFN